MSLSDLKNKGKRSAKIGLTVDEFIEQANDYAQGKRVRVDQRTIKRRRNYKNATFSLGQDHIHALKELADSTGLAKSFILRVLIEYMAGEQNQDINKVLIAMKDKLNKNKEP